MGIIKRFEDLECWQSARILTRTVYESSKVGPPAKDFDVRSQIRRASISSMSNIAEGFGRFSNREFIRFLEIAQSSTQEVRSLTYVIEDQGYLGPEQINLIRESAEKTKSLSLGLVRYLNRT